MLVVDAPRPVSREFPLERFRFADSVERRPQNVLDDLIDSLRQLSIVPHEPLMSQADGVNVRFMPDSTHDSLSCPPPPRRSSAGDARRSPDSKAGRAFPSTS